MKEQSNPKDLHVNLDAQQVQQYEYKDRSFTDCICTSKKFFFMNNQTVKKFSYVLALFFLILAGLTYFLSRQIIQIKIPYSVKRNCIHDSNEKKNKFSQTCQVQFQINQTMKGPVYMLYYVQNVYVNHQKFINSFSKEQLLGQVISEDQAYEHCFPIIHNKDLPWNQSWGGHLLDPQAIASPCGLKPLLFFNDTYQIIDKNGLKIKINETGIVKQDPGYQPQPQSSKNQWINPSNQHFENYMIDGSLMTKKRSWGVIENGLEKGKYSLTIINNYQINTQMITKGVQLSTSTAFGAIHQFFPVSFLCGAIICILYAILVKVKLDKMENMIAISLNNSFKIGRLKQ